MQKIKLLTDTGCDMLDELKSLDVDYIPLYISFDGDNYLKQIDEISIEEFYKRLESKDAKHPKTSCPSVDDYYNMFISYTQNKTSIIMICLNSKFSGAYQAAQVAKNMILEKYKDAEIYIVDSENCTYTQYVMCLKVKEMLYKKCEYIEIKDAIEKMKEESRIFMYVDDLTCLAKSGRVTNLTAQFASILNIKPILEFKDGVLEPTKKAKGSNKAVATIIQDLYDFLEGKDINDYKFGIVHGDRYDDALELKDALTNALDIEDIDICQLGVCIGVHAGPTLLGIAVIKYNNL